MLNTFENAEKQHRRRMERERHMNILSNINIHNNDGTFQHPLESEEMLPTDDVLAGVAPAKAHEEPHFSENQNRARWWRSNRFAIAATMLVVLVILLSFSLGFDIGEKEVESNENKGVADKPEITVSDQPNGLDRYNSLFNDLLDLGAARDELEDVTSAQARALHWLAYGDGMVLSNFPSLLSIETIRTRFALATIYFSTQSEAYKGDSWTSTASSWREETNWLSGTPVCQWYGVSCLQDEFGDESLGLVESLNLSSNALTGTLPDYELSLLQLDIRTLDVSGNGLGGTLPKSLSALKNLVELYLGPNKFEGSVPDYIYGLPHLTHLYTNDCNFTGTISTRIGSLTTLQGLGLHNNRLTGQIPEEIGSMESIQALYLDGNQLIGPIPNAIGELSGLVDLRLRRNQLTGAIPSEMQNLNDLQILYLDSNNLSGTIPAEIFSSVRFLRDLQLYDNRLTGVIPSEIGNLIFLSILYLDGNLLSSRLPSTMGLLTNLESLYLFDNIFEGFLPDEFTNMAALKSLRLNNNQLSGGLPDFGGLRNLETFFANNNTFGGAIPEELGELTNAKNIQLHGNKLYGSIPTQLCTSMLQLPQYTLTSDCAEVEAVQCDCCTECY